jgi:hypothetical protein
MIERLYSLRIGGRLFVSNSLTFVLAMGGDEPDPDYPFYVRRVRKYQDVGISTRRKSLRTRLGRRVRLHEYCQIAVGDDLRLVRIEKPVFPPPASFGEYYSMLRSVLGAVLENAASPLRRCRRYEGLATVSRGYDSNALAVLLSTLGVREAMTIYGKIPGDDSGEEIARHLGMTVGVYGSADFRSAPGVDEAEFLAWPDPMSGIVFAPCEAQLMGKILVTGQWGDKVFGVDDAKGHRDFRGGPIGLGRIVEFRLRTGFLNFNPLFAGGLHLPAMHRIATSPEMEPWRVGGTYDRPIARRIIEQAGIPRGVFASGKGIAPRFLFRSSADMSPAGRADFESYRRSMPRPAPWRRRCYRGLVRLWSWCYRIAKAMPTPVSRTGGAVAGSLIPISRRVLAWDDMDFAMHWGQSRIRTRYAEAVGARSQPS